MTDINKGLTDRLISGLKASLDGVDGAGKAVKRSRGAMAQGYKAAGNRQAHVNSASYTAGAAARKLQKPVGVAALTGGAAAAGAKHQKKKEGEIWKARAFPLISLPGRASRGARALPRGSAPVGATGRASTRGAGSAPATSTRDLGGGGRPKNLVTRSVNAATGPTASTGHFRAGSATPHKIVDHRRGGFLVKEKWTTTDIADNGRKTVTNTGGGLTREAKVVAGATGAGAGVELDRRRRADRKVRKMANDPFGVVSKAAVPAEALRSARVVHVPGQGKTISTAASRGAAAAKRGQTSNQAVQFGRRLKIKVKENPGKSAAIGAGGAAVVGGGGYAAHKVSKSAFGVEHVDKAFGMGAMASRLSGAVKSAGGVGRLAGQQARGLQSGLGGVKMGAGQGNTGFKVGRNLLANKKAYGIGAATAGTTYAAGKIGKADKYGGHAAPSAGRRATAAAFGPYHALTAAKKGKKLGALGSYEGHAIGGSLAGGAAGGGAGAGIGALAGRGAGARIGAVAGGLAGGLGGGHAGIQRSVTMNTRKGRFRSEAIGKSAPSAFGILH